MFLRRINILYLSIPLLCWLLLYIFTHINRDSLTFYGFAENKETTINIDHDVIVQQILVKPGQFVKKGTLLVIGIRPALDFKKSEIAFNMSTLASRDVWRVAEIKARIEQLKAERTEKIGLIQASIHTIEADQKFNLSLIKGLKSLEVPDSSLTTASPYNARLQALREELRLATAPFDLEISKLEQALQIAGIPEKTQIEALKSESGLYKKEEARLSFFAPTDGLIGIVHCKEGENVAAFTPLIDFYEQNPNVVVGFVHESLTPQIREGDSLLVISSLHPEHRLIGRITGLGHRIVEIPERLRKIPELKTYGREVMIEIPTENSFLQKEKVLLQRTNQGEGALGIFFHKNN